MTRYRIGITMGVFDLFHIGHLNLLNNCKTMCEHLIVGVCDDEYVRVYKQKEPVFPEHDRLKIIESLRCVDEAYLVPCEQVENKLIAWEKYHFDVLFSGEDWKGSERFKKTEEQFIQHGVSIEYFPYTEGVSSTSIKEKLDHS